MKKKLSILLLLVTALFFLYKSEVCARAAALALHRCLHSVIPSLFPYMALSSLLLSRGSAHFPRLIPTSKMGLSPCASPVFLTGVLCGFPVGAAGSCSLTKEGRISPEEGGRLIALSSHVSPAFLLGVVGNYWRCRAFGLFLFLFGLAFSFLCGAVLKKCKAVAPSPSLCVADFAPPPGLAASFCRAVTDAASACLSVTGFIVFFQVVAALLSSVLSPLASLFTLVLEFSSAVLLGAETGGLPGAALTGFAVGFSGLCVHAQLFSYAASASIPYRTVFWIKMAEGLCTAGGAAIFYLLHPMGATVISNALAEKPSFQPWLLLLVVALLFIFRKNGQRKHKFIPKS